MFVYRIIGVDHVPEDFRRLTVKYLVLISTFSAFSLSKAWLSLWILQYVSFVEYGVIYAAGVLVVLLLDFPMGVVTDKIGQKEAFIIAELMYFIYYLVIGYTSVFWVFLGLEVVSGIGNAFMTGSVESWFMDTWQQQQKDYSDPPKIGGVYANIITFTVLLTVIVMFLSGVAMGNTVTIDVEVARIIFLIQALIPLVAIFFGMKWIVNTNRKDTKDKTSKNPLTFLREYFDERTRTFALIMLLFGFVWALNSIYMEMIFGPLLNLQFGVTFFILSTVRTGGNFLGLTTRFSKRFMERFTNKRRVYLHSQFMTFPIYYLLIAIIINSALPVEVIIILFAIIHFLRLIITGLTTTEYYNLRYDYTDPQKRASQQSLAGTINSAILILGYWLFGNLLELYSYSVSLVILTIIAGIGMFGVYKKTKYGSE